MQSQFQVQEQVAHLTQKLRVFSSGRLSEVEDFVDFLSQKDQEQGLKKAVMQIAEPSFERIWNNADDADYDKL